MSGIYTASALGNILVVKIFDFRQDGLKKKAVEEKKRIDLTDERRGEMEAGMGVGLARRRLAGQEIGEEGNVRF